MTSWSPLQVKYASFVHLDNILKGENNNIVNPTDIQTHLSMDTLSVNNNGIGVNINGTLEVNAINTKNDLLTKADGKQWAISKDGTFYGTNIIAEDTLTTNSLVDKSFIA